jgi:hypothetical protein
VHKLFYIACFLFLAFSVPGWAQEEQDVKEVIVTPQDSLLLKPYTIDPLAPSKAAFYSAVVPGLGQIYNKKYWKAPIVWGGLGISLYYYSWNNQKYHEYRDAYQNRLAGRPVEGRLATLDNDRLVRAQRFHQKKP